MRTALVTGFLWLSVTPLMAQTTGGNNQEMPPMRMGSTIIGGKAVLDVRPSPDAASVTAKEDVTANLKGDDAVRDLLVRRANVLQNQVQSQLLQRVYLSGEAALLWGDVHGAEAYFRQAITEEEDFTPAYAGLAQALTAQGRTAEAIHAYRTVLYDLPLKYNYRPENAAQEMEYRAAISENPVKYSGFGTSSQSPWMRYVLLLCKTGGWAQAVNIYENILANVPDGGLLRANVHFNASDPQPVALEAAAHIIIGLDNNYVGDYQGNLLPAIALDEYAQALQLEPNSGVTNFYYGYGLQRLGRSEQASAAFSKTIKIANGTVREAAIQALKKQKKPV